MLELEGRAVAANVIEQAKDIAYASGLDNVWDKLAATYTETSPNGGVHWLYRVTGTIAGNTKLARQPGENGSVEVLAETRGEGGYVIVAPSGGGVHPSGGSWRHISGGIDKLTTFTVDEHAALHNLFRSFDSMPAKETVETQVKPKTDGEGLSPADDWNARATWADILTGWTQVYASGTVTYWRRPGKDIGISATTGRNDGDNLYVFTTSTVFEAEKPYSKFAAYALLNHGGDMSAAARQLRREGYGAIAAVPSPLQTPDLRHIANVTSQPTMPTGTPETAPTGDDGEEWQSTWQPVDLLPILNGTAIATLPSLFHRSDNVALLYAGKVHSFYGESESGKSWLAQYACAQTIAQERDVIYIDFESDAADIVERLRLLGVPAALIRAHFTYIRPEAAPNEADQHWQTILGNNYALAIIDGVTEALTIWGGETKDNDTITLWTRRFPRRLAKTTGAAVVTIDHVAKDKDNRGRFAIGGQAKLAALDGAAYLIEPAEVMAPGKVGKLVMRVTKDRPGQIRKHGGEYRASDRTQPVAEAVMDATGNSLDVAMYPPKSSDEAHAERIEYVMERVIEAVTADPGLSFRKLVQLVKARESAVREARDLAVQLGYIVTRKEGRGGGDVHHLAS